MSAVPLLSVRDLKVHFSLPAESLLPWAPARVLKAVDGVSFDILPGETLGVVAGLCDEVIVLYGGRIMEQGSAESIFYRPTHPYTVGLLGAVPRLEEGSQTLVAIPGAPPNMARLPAGCPFSERCTLADAICHSTMPALLPLILPVTSPVTLPLALPMVPPLTSPVISSILASTPEPALISAQVDSDASVLRACHRRPAEVLRVLHGPRP